MRLACLTSGIVCDRTTRGLGCSSPKFDVEADGCGGNVMVCWGGQLPLRRLCYMDSKPIETLFALGSQKLERLMSGSCLSGGFDRNLCPVSCSSSAFIRSSSPLHSINAIYTDVAPRCLHRKSKMIYGLSEDWCTLWLELLESK